MAALREDRRAEFHSKLPKNRLGQLTVYGGEDPILERIAQIVDEADTVQEAFLEPVAPGLDFICVGILLTSPDDLATLERGSLIFEALYAQLYSDKNQ